jgi:hypothetical protein
MLEGAEVDVVADEGDAQVTERSKVGEVELNKYPFPSLLDKVLVAVEGETVELGSEMMKGRLKS